MMERRETHAGPGAASLLLVVVVVSMSVLAVLAMLNVRGDVQLTRRSVALVEAQYAATAQAERDFALLDGLAAEARAGATDDEAYAQRLQETLPDGFWWEDGTVRWELEVGSSGTLHCAARLEPLDASQRLTWVERGFAASLGDEFIME